MAILDEIIPNNTLKTLRHDGVSTTVYSANALYSAIKDYEDDPANMTHPVIMTAQTPTEYTVTEGWFIDDVTTHFLNGGAIKTSGYLNEIQRVVTTDAGTAPVSGDIGKQVNDGGDVGPLVHYELDINDDGSAVNAWYVRTGSGTALTGALTITTGTGAQTVSTSVDGEEVWTNVFSFGVITSTINPQFYVEQILNGSDHRLIEWIANTNFSRGNMDVLIRTQVEGATNGLNNLLITIRQPGTLYDSSEQTLNGGRNPFALNSADDPDNTTSEWYLLFDTETGTDIAVNDTITADSKAWYATVSEVSYFDATTGYLGLVGLNESIDAVADADPFTSSGGGQAQANGTPGDRVFGYDGETGTPTISEVLTSAGGAKAVLVGIQDNGTSGYLCTSVHSTIDYKEDSTYYDLFVEDENITGSITDVNADLATLDLQLATSGLRGKIEVVFQHGEIGTSSNDLQVGDHVTVTAGPSTGATGIVTRVDGSTVYFGNTSADFASGDTIDDDDSARQCVTNTGWTDSHTVVRAFSQAANKNYDVIIFMQNETVQRGYEFGKFLNGDGNTTQFQKYNNESGNVLTRTSVDGQFYLSAYIDNVGALTYDKIGKRFAPLGTFAGGTWFTARGIWLESVASADAIKFNLIDSDAAAQIPPSFVAVTTNNNIAGDRVGVYEDDGTGLVKKDQYNSHATNNAQSNTTFEVDGTPSISLDVPAAGWVIVTDDDSTSGQVREHAYKYDSFSGDVFTLKAITSSTGTAGAGGLTHTNSGRNFTSDGVLPGMIVRNTTSTDIGIVDTVGTTTFTVKQLEGGGDGQFDTSDVVEINELVVAYVAADTAFVPFINEEAGGATTSVTVIYQSNKTLLGKVRNKGSIFAVDAAATLSSTGVTIPTVRNADTIAT